MSVHEADLELADLHDLGLGQAVVVVVEAPPDDVHVGGECSEFVVLFLGDEVSGAEDI